MFLRGRGGVVFWRRGVRRAGRTRRIRALREVRQQLADQVLEHERGLREIDLILVLEKGVGAAGSQADELAAEKALSVDARVAVRGNLVVTGIQAHEHHPLVFPQIQIDEGAGSHIPRIRFAHIPHSPTKKPTSADSPETAPSRPRRPPCASWRARHPPRWESRNSLDRRRSGCTPPRRYSS